MHFSSSQYKPRSELQQIVEKLYRDIQSGLITEGDREYMQAVSLILWKLDESGIYKREKLYTRNKKPISFPLGFEAEIRDKAQEKVEQGITKIIRNYNPSYGKSFANYVRDVYFANRILDVINNRYVKDGLIVQKVEFQELDSDIYYLNNEQLDYPIIKEYARSDPDKILQNTYKVNEKNGKKVTLKIIILLRLTINPKTEKPFSYVEIAKIFGYRHSTAIGEFMTGKKSAGIMGWWTLLRPFFELHLKEMDYVHTKDFNLINSLEKIDIYGCQMSKIAELRFGKKKSWQDIVSYKHLFSHLPGKHKLGHLFASFWREIEKILIT